MDILIILGGGCNLDCSLPLWCIQRCDYALKIYRDNPSKYYFIVSSAGTYHHPNPIDSNGYIIFESTLLSNYLIDNGVPPNKIIKESTSYDTIGNMFYIRTTITDIRKWYNLIFVTSDFHMERSKEIAQFIFNLETNKYILKFIQIETLIDYKLKSKRCKKEHNSLINFKKNVLNIKTLIEFHKWLYSNHDCYNSIDKKKTIIYEELLY